MKKILIPKNYCQIADKKITFSENIQNKLSKNNKTPFFEVPDAECVLNLKKSGKENENTYAFSAGFFNSLIKGKKLTINTENIYNVLLNLELNPSFKFGNINNTFSNGDYLNLEELEINSEYLITCKIDKEHFTSNASVSPLKKLVLNSAKGSISANINSLYKLEELIINNNPKTSYNKISINCLPSLKKLDISNITLFKSGSFSIENIPDKCIIKFNPNTSFLGIMEDPSSSLDLKSCLVKKAYSYPKQFQLKDILQCSDIPFSEEITFKDFKKAFLNYCNNVIKSKLEESIQKENLTFNLKSPSVSKDLKKNKIK